MENGEWFKAESWRPLLTIPYSPFPASHEIAPMEQLLDLALQQRLDALAFLER